MRLSPSFWAVLLVGLSAFGISFFLYPSPEYKIAAIEGGEAERGGPVAKADSGDESIAPSTYFLAALGHSKILKKDEAISQMESQWDVSFLPYFIEIYRFGDRAANINSLKSLLARKIGAEAAGNFDKLNAYVWQQDIENTPDYAYFKQLMHANIDPKFATYFEPNRRFEIRLDEVSWGGVLQDGIPPLRGPKMLKASKAKYLDDSNVVFGIEVEGEARAYPKRILAWHEMFVDTIAGVPLAGVYCTLCGTVILYETEFEGVNYELGTSGFLYRSNKLMYDRATQSLWSTLEGEPVIGPLVGKGIRLNQRSVVTTTWGEWKKRHPDTLVLSTDTGHRRDYGEGVAYQSYFGTDERMFETPFQDDRLKNKAEVLALRFVPADEQQVVVAADFLKETPIYEGAFSEVSFVILTDRSGANRVYERPDSLTFKEWDSEDQAIDSDGVVWTLSESALTNSKGDKLKRLPAHRAFWFGWHGAFPDSLLIK